MTDKLVPLNPTSGNATGSGQQNHSKAVEEDGRRFDELLSETDPDSDSGADSNDDFSGGYRSDGELTAGHEAALATESSTTTGFVPRMDSPFGIQQAPVAADNNSAIDSTLGELSDDIRSAFARGDYAGAKRAIDEFLAANPQIASNGTGAAGNGDGLSSHSLQVMGEILQFAEQMHDAVAGGETGRARMIASVSARSINTLITGDRPLLLPETANELSTHFVQILRSMPTDAVFWEPLAAGEHDRFATTVRQTALDFADLNPRLQALFDDHAMVAETGAEMGTFGAVTERTAGELIEQLDAWQAGTLQRPTAMAAIQALIDPIGTGSERSPSEINGLITELASQGKLETLFELFGEDRAVLIDQLATKGAEAVVSDPWYEQAMIGVWNERGSDIPGRVEHATAISR